MADSRRKQRGSDVLFGYLIPITIIGLAVADFARDGQIDKYLIAALMVFGLAALGYRVDTVIENYVASRLGRSRRDDEEDEPLQ